MTEGNALKEMKAEKREKEERSHEREERSHEGRENGAGEGAASGVQGASPSQCDTCNIPAQRDEFAADVQ